MENSTEDLLGIFEFLAPGLLSPDMKPGSIGRRSATTSCAALKSRCSADLPPKLLHDELLELTSQQRESYRLAEDKGVFRLSELGKAATIRHVFELVCG